MLYLVKGWMAVMVAAAVAFELRCLAEFYRDPHLGLAEAVPMGVEAEGVVFLKLGQVGQYHAFLV